MRAYEIPPNPKSLDDLRRVERPDPPAPGPHEVVVRLRAAGLNFRDHAIVVGEYHTHLKKPTIPCSDGAGEVTAVGSAVTRFKPGDRVVPSFFQVWIDGAPPKFRGALGAPLDGTLADFITLDEDGFVAMPPNLSFEEAATLPCAGCTAWSALMNSGTRVKAGDTVLVLGTGGVSMFALQIARAAGARVIVTSSSDAKIERAQSLGASAGVNYKSHPDWEKEVLALTAGRGVNCVIENGGVNTLNRSFQCLAWEGKVALIGVLAGNEGHADPHDLMFKRGSLHGIGVGTRTTLEQLIAAFEVNRLKPVIGRTFSFDQIPEAFRVQASGDFIGKIAITI